MMANLPAAHELQIAVQRTRISCRTRSSESVTLSQQMRFAARGAVGARDGTRHGSKRSGLQQANTDVTN